MKELSNRFFKLWAYTVSHSFLILRSPRKFPDQEEYNELNSFNVDIEFSGVAYLDIPNVLNGIKLSELKKNIPKKFVHFKTQQGLRIYELQSENAVYYIIAANFRIGRNNWLSEDRVQNMNLEYDEILATS